LETLGMLIQQAPKAAMLVIATVCLPCQLDQTVVVSVKGLGLNCSVGSWLFLWFNGGNQSDDT
jgi:hypothetical protein